MRPQKILILWGHLTSYLLASIRTFEEDLNFECEIIVVSPESNSNYPDLLRDYQFQSVEFREYENFDPDRFLNFDLVLISSWNYRRYRRSARNHKDACVIMCMDNQFHNSLKQSLFLRSMFGPYFVRNLFQYAFVAGPRQKNYAEMIGFTEDRIESGVYAYDDRVFFPKTLDSRLNQFCFVGRKVPVKGLNVLLKANNIYRGMCAENDIEPWNLIIAGPGSITGEFSIGVQELGYLNPREVAQLLASSKCFVLPSEFEPFGVVLTEAAACGCLLIASDAVGAADSLIESNVNGYIFAKNSHADLARALLKITQFTSIQENQGQTDSIARAQNFATSVWSEKVLNIFSEHKKLKP